MSWSTRAQAVFGSLLLLSASLAAAQAPAPSFDVASVKRSPATAGSWIRFLPGGRFSAEGWVRLLIQKAYGVEDYQVVGGPDWLNLERYDIEAKAGDSDAGKGEMTVMLRALLADRFKLRVREERRELPIYNLVVEKTGPRMRALKADEQPPCRPGPSFICGLTTMTDLATWLKYIVGRPVLDKTEVDGRFELLLDFDLYSIRAQRSRSSIRGQTPPQDYNKPSVFEALKEQFGLRLEPQKAPFPVLVVDSIQRPTEN